MSGGDPRDITWWVFRFTGCIPSFHFHIFDCVSSFSPEWTSAWMPGEALSVSNLDLKLFWLSRRMNHPKMSWRKQVVHVSQLTHSSVTGR